ncbi:MAG: hypothetical protein J0L96_18860 [Anaerolineae bacterium]|nr:hypothetical protein [Anaerolineae bacterium]
MQLNFATITLPTIMVWILGLIIFSGGALLGYFNMNVDARRKTEAAETKAAVLRTDAEKRIAEMERKLNEAKSLVGDPSTLDAPTLLRMRRESGGIFADMDGQPLTGTLTPERRKRLIELIGYFRPWLEGGQAPAAPAVPAPVSTPLTVPPAVASSASSQIPVSPITPPVVSSTVKPISIFGSAPKKQVDPQTEFKLMSMVQQIDTVLQKRLIGTSLEKIGLRLQDSLQGGLEVHIGTDKFESIDDVPNAEVKAAIRAAIAEWENKYVPGAS